MQPSPLEQLGLGRRDFLFLDWHSSLSILTCLACTLGHWKKTEQWGREGPERWPVVPCQHPLQQSSACLYLKRKRLRLSPPLLCLWISFTPSNRRSLLPEQADIVESHAAELYSRWGKNLLWINPSNSLVWSWFHFLLCQTGALLTTIDIFEASL